MLLCYTYSIMEENIYNNPPQSHKLRTGILILTFIGAIAGVYSYFYPQLRKEITPAPTVEKLAVDLVSNDRGQIPVAFPKTLVTEKNIRVLDSYVATTPQGVEQSTFRYLSAMNFKQNLDYFTQYLQKNKWSYVTQSNGLESASMVYTKQIGGTITVNISKNQSLQAYVVDITMEVLKK